tara:strand:- start:638 stop:1315 length:678 start_codon:yes stop_codon:yes gene_type:complete
MKKISLVLILFISFFSITEEKEVVFEGKKFVITLPEGYCDQTGELMGQIFLPYIKQNIANTGNTAITPLMIFSKCDHEFSFGASNHPWGWVTLQKDVVAWPQKELNNFMAAAVTEQSFIDEINKETTKGVEKTFRDMGVRSKIKGITSDNNGWHWGDEYVGIFSMVNEGLVDGEVLKERVLGAFTVVGKYQIGLYIANELNSDDDFEVLIYELAINGERLAKNNR